MCWNLTYQTKPSNVESFRPITQNHIFQTLSSRQPVWCNEPHKQRNFQRICGWSEKILIQKIPEGAKFSVKKSTFSHRPNMKGREKQSSSAHSKGEVSTGCPRIKFLLGFDLCLKENINFSTSILMLFSEFPRLPWILNQRFSWSDMIIVFR